MLNVATFMKTAVVTTKISKVHCDEVAEQQFEVGKFNFCFESLCTFHFKDFSQSGFGTYVAHLPFADS